MSASSIRLLTMLAVLASLQHSYAAAQSPPDAPAELMLEVAVPRYALIFANETYPTNPLPSAAKDADAAERMFRSMGFKVLPIERNRNAVQMKAAINNLRDKEVRFARNQNIRPVVLVYFSGHGFRSDDATAYLAGIDADTASASSLKDESVMLKYIEQAFSVDSYLILLIDGCRLRVGDKEAAAASKPTQRELAEYEPVAENTAPSDAYDAPDPEAAQQIIGFATSDDRTAAANVDLMTGEVHPSVYTEALEKTLGKAEALIAVELFNASNYVQDNYPKLKQVPVSAGQIAVYLLATAARAAQISADWEVVRKNPNEDLMNRHMRHYPESRFSTAARKWIASARTR